MRRLRLKFWRWIWENNILPHDCKKNEVPVDHPQFTAYCKKCGEPW